MELEPLEASRFVATGRVADEPRQRGSRVLDALDSPFAMAVRTTLLFLLVVLEAGLVLHDAVFALVQPEPRIPPLTVAADGSDRRSEVNEALQSVIEVLEQVVVRTANRADHLLSVDKVRDALRSVPAGVHLDVAPGAADEAAWLQVGFIMEDRLLCEVAQTLVPVKKELSELLRFRVIDVYNGLAIVPVAAPSVWRARVERFPAFRVAFYFEFDPGLSRVVLTDLSRTGLDDDRVIATMKAQVMDAAQRMPVDAVATELWEEANACWQRS